jgi:riboflavin biosynthesis pyrimidine reductase
MIRRVITRVLPSPAATVTIRQAYDVERPRPTDRPWVGVCMVASIDGSTVVAGRSAQLSNPNDTEMLRTLRSVAEVVIVGAGTVRAEGYGPPERPGSRIGVVTNSGRIDTTTALFRSGAGFLIAPASAGVTGCDCLVAGDDMVDLAEAVRRLPEMVPDVRFVQAEGGAVLNGSLLAAGLIDEINMTVSSQLAGGDGPRLTAGAPDLRADYDLAHLLVDDESFLFTRWVRRPSC